MHVKIYDHLVHIRICTFLVYSNKVKLTIHTKLTQSDIRFCSLWADQAINQRQIIQLSCQLLSTACKKSEIRLRLFLVLNFKK